MLKRQLNTRIIVLLVLSQSVICYATTVVVFVTPSGIVMGSDSGLSTHAGDFSPVDKEATTTTTTKFAVIHGHIVIGSIGVSHISVDTTKGKIVPYDFITWSKKVEDSVPANISVDDFASTVEQASKATFTGFDNVLTKDWWTQKNQLEHCRTFIHYIIAGYDAGRPKLYIVAFYIDWENKKLIGPKRILLHPSPKAQMYTPYAFGISQVLEDISNVKSYAYRQAIASCPAFSKLMVRHRDITLDETETIVRALIKIEETTNPTEVFGDIPTINLLPNGTVGRLHTEQKAVSTGPTRRKAKHKQN